MFNTISWTKFFTTILVILVLYYAVVIFLFFRTSFRHYFLKGKQKQLHEEGLSTAARDLREVLDASPGQAAFYDDAQQLLSQLSPILQTAALKNYPKEELLLCLQHKLQSNKHLYDTPFRFAVNNFLEAECSSQCSIHLENRDFDRLWKRMELSSPSSTVN